MKRRFVLVAVACLAVANCSKSTKTELANASKPEAAVITIVGCLVPGGQTTPGSPAATSGQTPATAPAEYVLIDTTVTNPTPSGSTTSPANGTPGATTPAVDTTQTPRSYVLLGDAGELQPHLNSRVEVVGTVVTVGDATASSAPASGAAPNATGTAGTIGTQQVRVGSIKKLEATCASTGKR
jgi:hypothetical protein